MRVCPLLLGLGAAIALSGCSSVVTFTGLPLNERGVYVSGVTPVHQDKSVSCGPACLAAVGTHWGVTLERFKAMTAGAPQETTGRDLQTLAEKMGLRAFVYRGSMDDLRENLGKGRPVIAMVEMPLPPRGDFVTAQLLSLWNELASRPAHWVTVVGLVGDKWVVIDDPVSGPLAIKADRFRRLWEREDSASVLIVGENSIPDRIGLSP